MGIGQKLRYRRKALGLSRSELAKMIHVTPSSIANYENGFSYPKPDILISLIRALEVDANYLYQDYLPDNRAGALCGRGLTEEEAEDVLRYKDLTERGKRLVRFIIQEEYERQQAEKWVEYPCILQGEPEAEYGFLLQPERRRVRFRKENLPEDAEFCFQIRETWYEPVYKKNTILVLKNACAAHNEIGIFKLDGICYLRMICQLEGECILRALSVNEPDIKVKDYNKLECVGTVLGQIGGTYEIL